MNASHKKSRNLSDTNHYGAPPKSIVFFVDRSLGKNKIVNRLTKEAEKLKRPQVDIKYEVDIKHLENFFPQDAPDEEWLPFVGEKSFAVLTKDKGIRRRGAQKTLVKRYNVRMFVLTGGNWPAEQTADVLAKFLKRMCRFFKKNPAPFIATISPKGTITKIELSKNGVVQV